MEDEKIEMKVDRFMDLMEEKELSDKCCDELDELLNILFDNTKLNYDKTDLYFDVDSNISGYLKAKERERYICRLKELQEKEQEKEEN